MLFHTLNMHTTHFDIDNYLKKFIEGDITEKSLQQATKDEQKNTEIATIKTASTATKEILVQFPNLKLLITRTVGTDHIDLDYCKARGIEVKNIPDYGSYNIAEHVFALLLAGARNIYSTQAEIRAGTFSHKNYMAFALKGKTMGVVGTGKIGLETARMAKAFGMKLLAYDVYKNENAAKEIGFVYLPLEELAKTADVVSLHAPLLDSTHHMINDQILDMMKEGSILINTARGGLIDTQALLRHISKFRFVGLDVLEDEASFSPDHPLLSHKNVLITPHCAFFSDESIKKIAEETMRLFANFTSGNNEATYVKL